MTRSINTCFMLELQHLIRDQSPNYKLKLLLSMKVFQDEEITHVDYLLNLRCLLSVHLCLNSTC